MRSMRCEASEVLSGEAATVTVLLSGGADSAALLAQLLDGDLKPSALFVDYDQPALAEERRASRGVARRMRVEWASMTFKSTVTLPTTGEIRGRNAMLLAAADHACPTDYVAIGVHGGTDYPDCSRAFIDAWQAVLVVQHGGATRVLAPFLDLGKQDVLALAAKTPHLLEATYSCERAGGPCGKCLSCRDRARFEHADA